jgi:hypothetical protein
MRPLIAITLGAFCLASCDQREADRQGFADLSAAPATPPAAPVPPPPPPEHPIKGSWAFQTADITPDNAYASVIRGVMQVRGSPGNYTCRFTAHQEYACRAANPYCTRPQDSSAEQTCTVSAEGPRVVITSSIVRAPSTYQADDFVLTLDGTEDRMNGTLTSAENADVTFDRLTRD